MKNQTGWPISVATFKHWLGRTSPSMSENSRKEIYLMVTWNDYKQHVCETNPKIRADIDKVEAKAQIISTVIRRNHDLNFSRRDLDEFYRLPHSSSENDSFYSEENLDHLVKSIQQLNDGKGIAHELIEDAEPKN